MNHITQTGKINKQIWKAVLYAGYDTECRTSYGSEFHWVGPVKENALWPNDLVLMKEIQSVRASEDERMCLEEV